MPAGYFDDLMEALRRNGTFSDTPPAAPQRPTGMFGAPPPFMSTPPIAPSSVEMEPRSMATLPTAKPSFFGQGGTGRQIVGILGDALSAAGGGQGVYAPMMQQQRMFKQQSQREDERSRLLADRQMELARFKAANPDEPSIIRTARSLGLQPGTDAFTSFVTKAVMAPRYMMMGSPETGQSIVEVGGYPGGGPAAPQVGAVEDGYEFLGGDPANPASWRKQ